MIPAATATVVALAVFVLDVTTPRGLAVGVLYVVPVLITSFDTRRALVLALAAACTGLIAIGYALSAEGSASWMVIANRGLSLLAVWITAALVLAYAHVRVRVAAGHELRSRLFRETIEAAPDAMLVFDREGVVRFANTAASRTLGRPAEALTGQSFAELVRASQQPPLDAGPAAVASVTLGRVEATVVRDDERNYVVEVATSRLEVDEVLFIAALRDVTERRHFEERLRSVQKMEAVGRLAGGIAHDFNNLLAAILSYAEFALDAVGKDHPARADIHEVLAASKRAASLTSQLLAFSRRQIIEPRRIDLNQLVLDMDRMLRRLLGADVELVTVADDDIWAVHVDPGQLEQVVLNLCVNARDAMETGGKLTIETRNVVLDESYVVEHPETVPGDYVMMAVTDTGVGMTPQVKARLFEPFFTTKELGRGTGLGLATTYGIVRQAGGYVWVYSEPGQGSTFKVYLPRGQGPLEPSRRCGDAPAPSGRGETILVVEDEPAVRAVAVRTLRGGGYTVLEASNGVDALLVVGAAEGRIDLMLTDVVMPQMGGRELAQRLHESYPSLRVLFMSGYTDNAIVHNGVLDSGMVFLQKPFLPADVLRKVRDLLDAPPQVKP